MPEAKLNDLQSSKNSQYFIVNKTQIC